MSYVSQKNNFKTKSWRDGLGNNFNNFNIQELKLLKFIGFNLKTKLQELYQFGFKGLNNIV